jgi:tRNA 5-methylaminomethyl-2-thiouridine biosynthesis bifunctional protein
VTLSLPGWQTKPEDLDLKTQPIVPARVDFSDAAVPFATEFGDVYHSRDGALEQARHVFLRGNRLPERWRGRRRFVVLETGFGLGNNFLATWQTWRADPERCQLLQFVSIEKHPLSRQDLARAHRDSPLPELAQPLIDAWPPLTCNLHRLVFDGRQVELLLALGDVADWLRALILKADAFMLDGFAPARNPQMWQAPLFRHLARLAAPEATAATWSVAREVRDGLSAAGFEVNRAQGFAGKREMSIARFVPRHTPPPPPGRSEAPAGPVVIVGAGLAGCAAAAALAEQGIATEVLEAHGSTGHGASNQRGGMFHGIVHGEDGRYARLGRAAALMAAVEAARAINAGVPGCRDGLLRLERGGDLAAMQQLLQRLGLPEDYVRPLAPSEATEVAGVPVSSPSWFFPGGGWIMPARLAETWLLSTGSARLRPSAPVARLQRDGERWHCLDAEGELLAEAAVIIIAAGAHALRLLAPWRFPLEPVRGQTTWLPPGTPGLIEPRVPVADAGYVLATGDGGVLCGASSAPGDAGLDLREEEHADNLDRLRRLTGMCLEPDAVSLNRLEGRVGVRLASGDRLPLIGALPRLDARPYDQPRRIERESGLYVFSALGSRGLSWAPLGARLLAAQIAGGAWPLESDLVDALDPARFLAREARKSAS